MAIGLIGGIAVVPEATYGTDPATGYTWLHGVSSTLDLRRSNLRPNRLGRGVVTAKQAMPAFVDGEIVLSLCLTETVVGDLLGLFGNISTSVFTFAADAAPDNDSLTVLVDHGGVQYAHTGMKPQSLRIDMPADSPPQMTVALLGQGKAKKATPTTVATPAQNLLLMQDDYGALTHDGTSLGHKGLSLTFSFPHTARPYTGAANIRKPIPTAPKTIGVTMTAELDNETGFDMESVIDDFLSGTGITALAIGSSLITFANLSMTAAPAPLQAGIQDSAVQMEADAVTINLS